jgi:hypothetical protein
MDDRAIVQSFEKGWGKRIGILVFALVVVAALVGLLFVGFHGRGISRGASALTPGAVPTQPGQPSARTVPPER